MPAEMQNPFVGPLALDETRPIFGRDAESRELVDLVTAKRIVLLISPSGAGKTSLLQAAVIPKLRRRLAAMPVVRFAQAKLGGANRYEMSALASLENRFPQDERMPAERLAKMSLREYVTRMAIPVDGEKPRYPLLVFDQFEELFTLDRSDWKAKRDFIATLGKLLSGESSGPAEEDPTGSRPVRMPVWAIFSMREDYVAELDPYLDLFPTALAFRYRLLPLEAEQAVEAIEKTSRGNVTQEAAKLVVADLQSVPVAHDKEERRTRARGRFVEPLLLQLTGRKLWEEVVAVQSRPVFPSDIAKGGTGKVEDALTAFFDAEVAAASCGSAAKELQLRDFIEKKLTSRGSVRSRFLADDLPEDLVAPVGRLLERHVLKRDMSGEREWLELVHDRLVAPACNSNQLWIEKNLSVLQRQAKLWDETNRSSDLLFSGEQLVDAEKSASSGESLTRVEAEFLHACRQERARLLQDQQRSAEIARANASLTKQRVRLLAALGLVACLFIWLGYVLHDLRTKQTELKLSELDARLKEAALFARDGLVADGLKLLAESSESILKENDRIRAQSVDLTHLRVMARLAPVEARLGMHENQVKAVAFAGDSGYVVSGSWDGTVKVWQRGKAGAGEPQPKRLGKVMGVVFNDENKLLATADDTGEIVLHRLSNGTFEEIHRFKWDTREAGAHLTSIAMNRAGNLLAASSWRKRLALWDISDPARPELRREFGPPTHKTAIYRTAFIPAGPRENELVAVDWDGVMSIWPTDPAAQASTVRVEKHRKAFYSLAVSPSGRWVAAGDAEGGLFLVDLFADSNTATAQFSGRSSENPMFGLAFDPAGSVLYTVANDEVTVWKVPSGTRDMAEMNSSRRRLQNWGERLYSVAVDPKDPNLIAVGGNHSVQLGRATNPNMLSALVSDDTSSGKRLKAVAASGDLSTLVSVATNGKTVRLLQLDPKGTYRTASTEEFERQVVSVAMRRDASAMAALGCDGELRVKGQGDSSWLRVRPRIEAAGGSCPQRNSLAFVRKSGALLVGFGSTLELWSNATGSWMRKATTQLPGSILALAVHPTEEVVAVAGQFGRVDVLDLAAELKRRASTAEVFGAPVVALAFTADGRTVVVGADSVDLTAWSWPGLGRMNKLPTLHERTVNAIATADRGGDPVMFTADRQGQLAACFGSLSKTACAKLSRPFGDSISALAVSDDGERLLCAGDDLYIWRMDRRSMVDRVARHVADLKP